MAPPSSWLTPPASTTASRAAWVSPRWRRRRLWPLATGTTSGFDPRRADEGQNPFQLDSKAPTASYRDFIMGEVRYNSLTRSFPDRAEKLFANAEKYAVEKYERLKNPRKKADRGIR